jgi:leucyl aminopeptidase (aminopeptidase T)
MTAIFSDHFSIVYDICRAACHGDTALGRSSVKKLAALIESSTPDDAALLKRLTKKAAKNPANFVQTALDEDDARECLMDVVSHHHDFRTACIEIKAANETTRSDELYWQKQIDVLDRMKGQAERALTAAQSASGDSYADKA